MAQFFKIVITFFCVIVASASELNDVCSWTDEMSQCDTIRALQKSLIAIEGKMVEFVEQQYIIKRLSRKLELQGKEIHLLGKTLEGPKEERNWELPPKAEPLVWQKDQENNEIGDESYSTRKLDHLLKQMQNLSSNWKIELENERRVRRSFQEEVRTLLLNSTHPLVSIHERLDILERTILNISADPPQKVYISSTERRLEHLERNLSLLRRSLNDSVEKEEEGEVKKVAEQKDEVEEEMITCPPLDYKSSPGLVIKASPDIPKPGHTAYFSCNGDQHLVGDAFTRCRTDGTWSHSSFPLCLRVD